MGVVGLIGNIAGVIGGHNAAQAQAQLQRQLGAAQKQAYDAQAEVSDQNAAITEQAAEVEAGRGSESLRSLRSQGGAIIGSQRAAMGAAGLATTSGTPALVLEDASAALALDVEALRMNNRRTKWGHDVQATNYRNQARMQRHAGKVAEAGGAFQADATSQAATTGLLTGITGSVFKFGEGIGAFARVPAKMTTKTSSWRRGS